MRERDEKTRVGRVSLCVCGCVRGGEGGKETRGKGGGSASEDCVARISTRMTVDEEREARGGRRQRERRGRERRGGAGEERDDDAPLLVKHPSNVKHSHVDRSSQSRERTPRQVEVAVVGACSRSHQSHQLRQQRKEEGKEDAQVGQESATKALMLSPVSVRVMVTYLPQCEPES